MTARCGLGVNFIRGNKIHTGVWPGCDRLLPGPFDVFWRWVFTPYWTFCPCRIGSKISTVCAYTQNMYVSVAYTTSNIPVCHTQRQRISQVSRRICEFYIACLYICIHLLSLKDLPHGKDFHGWYKSYTADACSRKACLISQKTSNSLPGTLGSSTPSPYFR